eukprot:2315043-Rhodomonas_salina.3
MAWGTVCLRKQTERAETLAWGTPEREEALDSQALKRLAPPPSRCANTVDKERQCPPAEAACMLKVLAQSESEIGLALSGKRADQARGRGLESSFDFRMKIQQTRSARERVTACLYSDNEGHLGVESVRTRRQAECGEDVGGRTMQAEVETRRVALAIPPLDHRLRRSHTLHIEATHLAARSAL